jgi:hypothetical protein
LLAVAGLALGLAACGDEVPEATDATASSALVVACVDESAQVPDGAWVCGEDRVVECQGHDGVWVDVIHAPLAELGVDESCATMDLDVSDEGPFLPGDHAISVFDAEQKLCTSQLRVVDTTPPIAAGARLELWPPNHDLFTLAPEACALDAADACDPALVIDLLWVTSDEPADGLGDGDTEVDIVDLGCQGVQLRAERSGPEDGRVYQVGYRVRDAAGNAAEGTCRVDVPHDQGHDPVAPGPEAQRVELAGCP